MKTENPANGPVTANGSAPPAVSRQGKTFLEFFAGIGLVDEGLRPSGWQCVYANDNDHRKQQMHASRNGPVANYHVEDVAKTADVIARIPGSPFLATASFPCVDLSLAGHWRGFEGQHSSTFFAFTQILKELAERKPKLVLLENVAGFLSVHNGADFAAAAQSLAELGYWLDAIVLDAAHFVPQSRPRVFVIGMTDDIRPRASAASLGWVSQVPAPSRLRPKRIVRFMETLPLPTGWATLNLPAPPARSLALSDCLDLDEGQEWWDGEEVDRHYRMMSDLHRREIDLFLSIGQSFVGTIFRRVRKGKGGQRAEVRFDGLAGCLRTPRGGSGRQIVIATAGGRLRMRWMSPREYARLQGAPDFPLALPRNRLLFGFADAVCVPAIAWIDRHALTPLYESAPVSRRTGRARQSLA